MEGTGKRIPKLNGRDMETCVTQTARDPTTVTTRNVTSVEITGLQTEPSSTLRRRCVPYAISPEFMSLAMPGATSSSVNVAFVFTTVVSIPARALLLLHDHQTI